MTKRDEGGGLRGAGLRRKGVVLGVAVLAAGWLGCEKAPAPAPAEWPGISTGGGLTCRRVVGPREGSASCNPDEAVTMAACFPDLSRTEAVSAPMFGGGQAITCPFLRVPHLVCCKLAPAGS